MDCTAHGILQARILEWVTFPFFRESSETMDKTAGLSHCRMNSLPPEAQGKPKNAGVCSLSPLQQIFLTQESNQDLWHCRQILYQLSYQGCPHIIWPHHNVNIHSPIDVYFSFFLSFGYYKEAPLNSNV